VSPIPILATAQVRDVESRARGRSPALMDLAGHATAAAARRLADDTGAAVLVVAGPGNNGGDAWVAAALLRESFARVVVLDFAGTPPQAPEARAARQRFEAAGGQVVREWPEALQPSLVIDGLLGIGLGRDVDAPMGEAIARINGAGAPVLSIDVPSGLDAQTGRVRGSAVRASHTLTFIARKPGLHTLDGPDQCGVVECDDLGLHAEVLASAHGTLLTPAAVRGWLAPRPRNSHKGAYRSLGIIGGNRGMVGAALLAARAGLFSGAGKVFVGLLSPDAPSVDPVHPELMVRPLDDVAAADVVVAGPGAGQSPSATSASMFERSIMPALMAQAKPLVLDADALNAIAFSDALRQALAARRSAATLLTPHPAEAGRLLGIETAGVQSDRVAAALALAARFGAHVVLKGAGSVCAFPDGRWSINATGNPGLASGGTGDVLAGMIGALLCQGLAPAQALQLAVCLHGAAADALVARGEGPVGLTASELLPEVRRLLNELCSQRAN
jgi:ADP-dependent NAD(P)H-hydrate dehydratase / NAD(P)H-hydrate epimerase